MTVLSLTERVVVIKSKQILPSRREGSFLENLSSFFLEKGVLSLLYLHRGFVLPSRQASGGEFYVCLEGEGYIEAWQRPSKIETHTFGEGDILVFPRGIYYRIGAKKTSLLLLLVKFLSS